MEDINLFSESILLIYGAIMVAVILFAKYRKHRIPDIS